MNVQVGMKVEVRCVQVGIQYHIRYDHLLMDNVYCQPLVEDVLLENIKPDPLLSCSVIEAFDCVGWWKGIIYDSFVSPLSFKEFYEVYFPNSCTLKPFMYTQLHPRQAWLRGEWLLIE